MDIDDVLRRAVNASQQVQLSSNKKMYDTAGRLKRETLGIFRTSGVVGKDHLAAALLETRVAFQGEVEEICGLLDGARIPYSPTKYLAFERLEESRYRVSVQNSH
jgi:hypothetical protein